MKYFKTNIFLIFKYIKKIFTKVIGVELNQSALEQFFYENKIEYTIEVKKDFQVFTVKYNLFFIFCFLYLLINLSYTYIEC